MTPTLPPPIPQALQRLERRLLTLTLLHGGGTLVASALGLLAALFLLDRFFTPPLPFRVLLVCLALALLLVVFRRRVLQPLRRRPAARDLARHWERCTPSLRGSLVTAVELAAQPGASSPALLAESMSLAATHADELRVADALYAAPAMRRTLLGALLLLLTAGAIHTWPTHASVFANRILGGSAPWPHATHLVLLPPYSESQAAMSSFEQLGEERFSLRAARGTILVLRVRAEGKSPETVVATDGDIERPMRPLGGGTFVLRLPPLEADHTWTFTGGDDRDRLPSIELTVGEPPHLGDWSVQITPPPYTGLEAEVREEREFLVPEGTRLQATFSAIGQARIAGSDELLPRTQEGRWLLEVVAENPGKRRVELQGEDGFVNPRAAQLRWATIPDDPPTIRISLPPDRFAASDEGVVPFHLVVTDDYGLRDCVVLSATDRGEEMPVPGTVPQLDSHTASDRRLLPPPDAGRRFRYLVDASDFCTLEAGISRVRSPWVERLPAEAFGERLLEQMARIRGRVEQLADDANSLAVSEPPSPERRRSVAQTLERDLERLHDSLEAVLLERLCTLLDGDRSPLLVQLLALWETGAPPPGTLTDAIQQPLSGRADLLLGLARAVAGIRRGPAAELRRAVGAGEDPAPHAAHLRTELEAVLDILAEWQDFESAVQLLRGMIERQRAVHLRTRQLDQAR